MVPPLQFHKSNTTMCTLRQGAPGAWGGRLATLNINNINKRLDNLLAWLTKAEPDVVSLQELYRTSTSLPRDFRARSNVINFKPATAVKANMYASAQTFGERLGIRVRARNSFSISSGSGTKTTRSSAQIRSHRLQASAIDFVSSPMICSVVRSLRTVICVNRPKRNCSCPACSNQDRALSECICRLHRSASQTLASRKFNVFIDLLIRQVYRWSFGNNQRKFDPLWPRPLCLQDHTSHTEKNQFTNRTTSSRRLLL